MKSYIPTEVIGCAFSAFKSIPHTLCSFITFHFIVNSVKTFSENEKRTYLGVAGAGPIGAFQGNVNLIGVSQIL